MKSNNPPDQPKTCICWATPRFSVWELSNALSNLQVSHSFRVTNLTDPTVVNRGKPQPMWVHVTPNIADVQEGSVNFISAAYAVIGMSNIPTFPDPDQYNLELALKVMLESRRPPTKISVNEPRALDYVAMVSKPSLLNEIQTLIYKIQPYSLRKETQAMVLRFFQGKISRNAIVYFLRKSFKTAELISPIERGSTLREAVAASKVESVEAVAKRTGISTFDLIYLGKERVAKVVESRVGKKAAPKQIPNSMRIANKQKGKVIQL